MKISDLFKKGKKEQEEIDDIIKENVTPEESGVIEEEPAEEEVITQEDQLNAFKKVKMDVDKLTAELEAIREMNKVNEERYHRASEEIGELRRAGIEREKKIDTIRVKTEKAVQLVEQVQPQNLMKEVRRGEAKTDALEAKEKANRQLIDHITEEIKEIKSTISSFRGMESLIKLNEEMKKEIKVMQQTEALSKKHADKVENIFVRVQKSFNKFSKLSQDFRSLENRFKELVKESEEFKRQQQNLAQKDDLEKLQKELEKKLEFVDKAKKELKERSEELEKKMPEIRVTTSESKKLEERLRKRLAELDDELAKLTRMEQKGYVTEEKFNQELEDLFNNLLKKIEKLEDKISK